MRGAESACTWFHARSVTRDTTSRNSAVPNLFFIVDPRQLRNGQAHYARQRRFRVSSAEINRRKKNIFRLPGSKSKTQGQLQFAFREVPRNSGVRGRGNAARNRAVIQSLLEPTVPELRRVQHVEKISAELQLDPLPDRDIFHQARIQCVIAGTTDRISSQSSWNGTARVGEVPADNRLAGGMVDAATNCSDEVGAVIGRVVVVEEIERRTALQCENAVP